MKKFFVIVLSALLFAGVASAQPRAIGARLGGDAELSYQHSLGSNFLEADLGMALGNYGGFRLTGIYDFAFELASDFNFYIGPGAQLGMYSHSDGDPVFGVGLGGQLGLEYQIPAIPLNISLDWRPMWSLTGNYGTWTSAALGIRYRF